MQFSYLTIFIVDISYNVWTILYTFKVFIHYTFDMITNHFNF